MSELVIFIVAGAGALAGALTLVLAKHPVYSALGMLGTLFSLAVLYVSQLAHFVAAVQVVVYAGAIMTLFLFVIMLIGVDKVEDTKETIRGQRLGAIGVLAASGLLGGYLWLSGIFTWEVVGTGTEPVNGTIEETGKLLFAEWVLPFEVTSLLLIVASVGAVGLALFKPRKVEDE